MNVTLREITPDNFQECIDLKVGDGQETFVASNVKSIAQAKIYPSAVPLAVYHDDVMVGFSMHGFDADDQRYYLIRLMIDEKQQGKGYGKAAVRRIIERMREINDCREIYLSFVPDNTAAEKLYQSIGFERTGEISAGEIVMRYDLKKAARNEHTCADN